MLTEGNCIQLTTINFQINYPTLSLIESFQILSHVSIPLQLFLPKKYATNGNRVVK